MDKTNVGAVTLNFMHLLPFVYHFCIVSSMEGRNHVIIILSPPQSLALCKKDRAKQYAIYEMKGFKKSHTSKESFCKIRDKNLFPER